METPLAPYFLPLRPVDALNTPPVPSTNASLAYQSSPIYPYAVPDLDPSPSSPPLAAPMPSLLSYSTIFDLLLSQ